MLKKSQLNHNVSTDYIPPCPQWEESSEEEVPVLVPAPGMVYQLVPIKDLGDEEEEDSEIEEELAMEIAAMDPAPAYTE